MKEAPSQSTDHAAAGGAGPHIAGLAAESLSVRDTASSGERAFTEDTVTTGIYVHREQIVARLNEVGLLKHPQVTAAIATVEQKEESGEFNGELKTPEGFARAVFLELTGSKAAANTVVTQLIHDPDVTEYKFGDKGVIVDRHYGKGGMAEILAVYFYGDPETGSYKGIAAVKAANATDVSTTKDRFGIEMKLMAKHSNGDEKGKRGYKTIFAEYYKQTGVIPLINPKSTTIEVRDYYAMELLKGHSLQDVLDEILEDDGLPLDPQVAINLLVTLLVKLKNFKGEMHRDIKPDNIFVLDDGTVRFLDCGLSLEESSENVARMTQTTDGAMGTLNYMAPEQLGGGGKGGKLFASDVYSLAASIYELVTRTLPIEGEEIMDFWRAHDKGVKPSFVVNSKVSHANHPEQVEAAEQESLLLDHLNPTLAGALRQMLNFKPEDRLVPGTDAELFLRDDPQYKDGTQDFHITDKEAKAQLAKWIDELLPASSFTLGDIEDGNPSIFQSAVLPKNRELTPELQLGSDLTRHEMYSILTGPSLATIKELERFEAEKLEAEILKCEELAEEMLAAEKLEADIQECEQMGEEMVAAERKAHKRKIVGWTATATAAVALSVASLMFVLNKKKPTDNVGPDTPIGGQLDPSNPGSTENIAKIVPPIIPETTPAKFRDYPGAEKPRHSFFLKQKTAFVHVGDDFLLFHNADAEALKNGDYGSLVGLAFNQEDDHRKWNINQEDENNRLLLGNGVSTMRTPFADYLEQYRNEIGSTETTENLNPYYNGFYIGDYMFSVVDGEASSVLYYLGVDAGSADAPKSVVFDSPVEAKKYLINLEVSGQGSLYQQLMDAQYTEAQGPSDIKMSFKQGHNQHGRETLPSEELKKINETMKNVLGEYFDSSTTPSRFRIYPGGSKLVFIPREHGYSYAEVGNDCLYFYNEKYASEEGEEWAEGIESDGALIGLRYNGYHDDTDGGFKKVYSDESSTYENPDGSSAFRSQLENADFYRIQIGSTETKPNEAPYLSGVRIGDYVLCVVDNEPESVLYYVGRDKKENSIVFPNGQECANYLSSIGYIDGALLDAFSNVSFEAAKHGRDKKSRGKLGHDSRGKKLLSGNDHNDANSVLRDSINTYFNASVETPAEEMLSRARPYPGGLRQEFFAAPRGWSGKIIGNDQLVFFQEDFTKEETSDWAKGRETAGVFYGISYNYDPSRYSEADAGRWMVSGSSAEMMFESSDGSSGFRSPLKNTDKYRLEIGSLASVPNKNTHMNGIRIGDYILCVVDGESESVLYYIGEDKEGASLMFPSADECMNHLRKITHGESNLYEAFTFVDFDIAKGKQDKGKAGDSGFDSRGRPILKDSAHDQANSVLRDSITSYFNSTASQKSDPTQAIVERE